MSDNQWIVKVQNVDHPAHDINMLIAWAREGRIRTDTLVFHPVLQKWQYAKDTAEVSPYVIAPAAQQSRSAARSCFGLAIVCFLFAFLDGMMGGPAGLGILLGAAAFGFLFLAGILYALRK